LPLLVEDLAAVVDAVSPDAPVHLVAHDWGSIQSWEAVVTGKLAGTFASYTSISGPPLDHAALWARRHRSLRPSEMVTALRQALHSWYIAFFHMPWLPELFARTGANPAVWARSLHRLEGAAADATWPAPTLPSDFAHGVQLYRANVGPKFRNPVAGHTDTPVQIIVPTKDRFVTASLLEGLESWSTTVWRRNVDAGHWVIRTHPKEITDWVSEVIAFVDDGTESSDLAQWRLAS
jgi:alpha-beta hydrolase superfamily lysophospholipase